MFTMIAEQFRTLLAPDLMCSSRILYVPTPSHVVTVSSSTTFSVLAKLFPVSIGHMRNMGQYRRNANGAAWNDRYTELNVSE